ncbi:DinB family protein [Dactylosporangium sp. NPDC049140]|uniref:DinB family protein n=1 Tax=Dactylosporangium sp. NPDC049140 TaxID=3155647 RepID=UPI0033E0AB30
MINADEHTEATTDLVKFLEAQRASVLAIVDGLDEEQLHTAVVPSGWTPIGLVEHLGYAERYWFQRVFTGTAVPLAWPAEEEAPPHATRRTSEVVLGFYRDQIARANKVLASTPLSAPPQERHGNAEIPDLRYIVLHMIEETARHAGHLDIARELLDGRTGLGPR